MTASNLLILSLSVADMTTGFNAFCTLAEELVARFAYFLFFLIWYVTNYYYGSIPVLNELHLVSSGSKSHLISGGDGSCSRVFIRALGPWEERSWELWCWVGSWWYGGSWKAPVPPQLGCWIWEEYKHSAWIQSLLITPETGWYNGGREVHTDAPVTLL